MSDAAAKVGVGSVDVSGATDARAEACKEARRLLGTTPLAQLLKPQHIVTLKADCAVGPALAALAHHKVLSAPVVNAKGAPPAVLGFVDVRDVLGAFLHAASEATAPAPMLARMRSLEEAGAAFSSRSLKDAVLSRPEWKKSAEESGTDGAFVYKAAVTSTVLDIVEGGFLVQPKDQRAEEPRGEHRLGVFDQAGAITNIISQTDVVRFLLANLPKVEQLGKLTAHQLGLGVPVGWPDDFVVPGVVSVKPERPTIEALELMYSSGLSAVAVIDDGGVLVANLSVSDFKGMEHSHFGALALPVAEFLALLHGTSYMDYSAQGSDHKGHPFFGTAHAGQRVGQHLVTCVPSTSFAELLDLFVRNGVHRIYMMRTADANSEPLGMISLTDILDVVV